MINFIFLYRTFFDWLGNELGYKQMEDWYQVTQDIIFRHGGESLVTYHYNSSPLKALEGVYPEHKWLQWRFGNTSRSFWMDRTQQRQFFDWLGIQLGYKKMEDWYQVTKEDIYCNGGEGLLRHYYSNSRQKALRTVYPENDWLPWKFGNWKDRTTHKHFLQWLGTQLGYQKLDDWYQLSRTDVLQYGGSGMLATYYNNSPAIAVKLIFSEHIWETHHFKCQ